MKIQRPTLARNVIYTFADGRQRAAVISGVCDTPDARVNLHVLLDSFSEEGDYPGAGKVGGTLWLGSVPYGDADEPDTWRYPVIVKDEIEVKKQSTEWVAAPAAVARVTVAAGEKAFEPDDKTIDVMASAIVAAEAGNGLPDAKLEEDHDDLTDT